MSPGMTSRRPPPRQGPAGAARFGGPAGWEVCERDLVASTGDLVAAMQAHRSRPRRQRVAADLLLAAAWAPGVGWPDVVGWLRGYAAYCGQAGTAPGAVVVDTAAARTEAEQAYARNQADWLDQPARVREAVSSPNSAVGRWYQQQVRTWAELTALADAGRLDRAPMLIVRSLVHLMLHEQLEVAVADEVQVAWLLSLALVTARPREPFFTDSVHAAARQMHEQSKYFVFRGPDQMAEESTDATQGRQELTEPEEIVTLARPTGVPANVPGLTDVLLARRSSHGRYHGQLTVDELSALLFYAAGVTGEKFLPGGQVSYPVRSYPSGGGRYPIRLLLYCHDVAGLPRGTYLYDPEEHALGRLSSKDISAQLLPTSMWLDPRLPPPKATGRIDAADCPLWIFPIADLTYQRLAYGLRSYRLVLVECGHLAQNLSLVATWLGRCCIGLGGYLDDAVNQVMGVDGVNTSVLYIYLIGDVEPPD